LCEEEEDKTVPARPQNFDRAEASVYVVDLKGAKASLDGKQTYIFVL